MDLEYIENLAELLSHTKATEVTVRRGNRAVTVRRRPDGTVQASEAGEPIDTTAIRPATMPASIQLPDTFPGEHALVPLAGGAATPPAARFKIIRAHRVGIFHRCGEDNQEPLIAVGNWAAPQQQLASIESMELFDEVDNSVGGRVIGIFVDEGAPVEYGQPLFHIEICDDPSDGRGAVAEGEVGA